MRLPARFPVPADAPPPGACVRIEELEPGVKLLVLDPPHRRMPIFDFALLRDLDSALEELARDPSRRGLVIAGRSPTIFVAGADIDAIAAIREREVAFELARFGEELFERVARLAGRKVLAAGGAVPGGACELALSCDCIVLADHPSTRIGLPEVRLGILPGWGGTQRLPRRLGVPKALEAILSGRLYTARDALRIGLVDRVTPPESLLRVAQGIAAGRESPRAKKRGGARWWIDRNPLALSIIGRKARESVERETRGNYPAPYAALELVLAAPRTPLAAGLEREAGALAELAVSDVCKSLVAIFRLSEEAKKTKLLPDGGEARRLARVGVIGAGIMGAGIAALAAQKGASVRLSDVVRAPLDAALHAHRRELDKQRAKRRLEPHLADAASDRLEVGTGLTGLSRCDLVIEAVVERLEVKRQVFGTLARTLPRDAILATNTSSLSVADIAAGLPHPERVVGLHFFNPVALMPLVEIVRGPSTADWVVAASARFALDLGKTPVIVGDCAGFLVNRLLGPYLDEAARLFEAGVEIERVDALLREFGMPMGPFELLDEVGLDVAAHAARSLSAAYGARMSTSSLVARMQEAGLKGKKGGAGFYTFEVDARTGKAKRGAPNPRALALGGAPPTRLQFPDSAILDNLLMAMINEAAFALEEGVVAGARELDLATVFGMGFPPFRGGLLRWADTLGAKEILARMKRIQNAPDLLKRPEGGRRFDPAPLLTALAASQARFHG